jgi:ubiquinone/menaquinone biosynthesis C-methylase UbiE
MHDEYAGPVARTYDAVYGPMRGSSGDAAFYRALAEERGGPVLEVGCGTGRVLLPIAALGLPCVGVDASAAMLAELRTKSPPPNLTLVEGRMESLDLPGRQFRLVTAPFRAFQHMLDVETQLAALAGIRKHLLPGGSFAFDVFDPKLAWLVAPDDTERLDATFTLGGVLTRRWSRVRIDRATQILHLTFRFEPAPAGGPPSAVPLRWFHRYELEHLLARAGFTDLTFYGGFDRRPWQPEGETVVVARAP